MDEVDAAPSHWAVLIGINFYMNPAKPLEGCVRDVQSMEQYLKTRHAPTHIDIFKASKPADTSSRHPTETPNLWPTYDNVTSSLKKITNEAKPGDFVYIHFSGHGTQEETTSSEEYSNKDTGDLALVLFDQFTANGVRYLHGRELANLLSKMVNKGLLVTVILDCCFSGSVIRRNEREKNGVRAMVYDSAVDTAYPQQLDPSISLCVGGTTLRNARIRPNWLINPDGYIILTACGPHEVAQELTLDGMKHGALSYFLVRALISLTGTDLTHQLVYDHLRMKFHVYWPRQTPMRYGNKDLSFFGKLRSEEHTAFIHVLRKPEGNRLYLGVGHVHGVCEDEEYAVYPLESSEETFKDIDQASFHARVTMVGSVQSDLVATNKTSIAIGTRTRWKARRVKYLSPWKIPVQLMIDDGNQTQWMEIAKSRPYLRLFTEYGEGQPYLLNLTRNTLNEYEFLNESYQRILSLPKIPADKNRAMYHAMSILEHVATFKYIEGIENEAPKQSFEKSLKTCLSDTIGNDLQSGGVLDVKDGEKVVLTVQNLGKQPLYMALLYLGPSWQIDDLVSGSGGGDSIVVPPRNDKTKHTGKREISLQMTNPESLRDQDQYECEDIFKVFITNKPSSFTTFQLPKLHTSAEEFQEPLRGSHRQLSNFLSSLIAFRRGEEDNTSDNWTTRSFVVHTFAERI